MSIHVLELQGFALNFSVTGKHDQLAFHFTGPSAFAFNSVVVSNNRDAFQHQTYQVSRIRHETHAFGLCLTLTHTATIFSRIGARPGRK